MKTDTIIEVINKLVGEINPIGETNIDNQRYDNLIMLCTITNELLHKIFDVSIENKDRSEFSMKRAGRYAETFLNSLKE